MKLSKRFLFIILAIAIIPLLFALLIEYTDPLWYARGSFIQFFLAGFSIVGCGLTAIYFFMLYSAYRKKLLDEMNVFIVNFLVYLKDFRDNLSNQESFDDSLERLKKITDEKKRVLADKSGFMLKFTAYPRIIKTFSGFIDEYVEIHNTAIPQIFKTKIPFEREQLINMTLRQVDDIARRGYVIAKKYARKRGGSYKFEDFKALIGAEEYEKLIEEEKARKAQPQPQQFAQQQPPNQQKQPKPSKPEKQPKQPKKGKKGQEEDPQNAAFGQQPPPYAQQPPFGQQPPPGWAQQQQPYQQQRPAGTPPPNQTQYYQQQPAGGQTQYQPQRPAATPPPNPFSQQPAGGQTQYQPQRPAATPPPDFSDVAEKKERVIKPPPAVKPPEDIPFN